MKLFKICKISFFIKFFFIIFYLKDEFLKKKQSIQISFLIFIDIKFVYISPQTWLILISSLSMAIWSVYDWIS